MLHFIHFSTMVFIVNGKYLNFLVNHVAFFALSQRKFCRECFPTQLCKTKIQYKTRGKGGGEALKMLICKFYLNVVVHDH